MLLELPCSFRRPGTSDAGEEIEVACDWIEASVLFSNEVVTSPDVTDLLEESQWFQAQVEAREFVDLVWSRMQARRIAGGSCGPFNFGYQSIELKVSSWEEAPAHAFCLLLSYARHNLEWAKLKKLKWNYNAQGDIFETMTCRALEQLLPTWTVYRTGWSSAKPAQLGNVVKQIAQQLCGEVKNLERWNKPQAKEEGLDILCYRHFADGWGNFPAFFIQCASGKHFHHKLKDPDLTVWNDLVSVIPPELPCKGFATPFMFPQRQFQQYALKSHGLLLDRCRILSAELVKQDWLDARAARQIIRWAKPLINKLSWSE